MARVCCSGRVVACCGMMVLLLRATSVPHSCRRLVYVPSTVVRARICFAEQQNSHAREHAIFVPVVEPLGHTNGTNVDLGTALQAPPAKFEAECVTSGTHRWGVLDVP